MTMLKDIDGEFFCFIMQNYRLMELSKLKPFPFRKIKDDADFEKKQKNYIIYDDEVCAESDTATGKTYRIIKDAVIDANGEGETQRTVTQYLQACDVDVLLRIYRGTKKGHTICYRTENGIVVLDSGDVRACKF